MYFGNTSVRFPFTSTIPFCIIFLIVFCDKLYVKGYIGIILPVFLLSPCLSNTGDVIDTFPNILLIFP